MATLQIPVVNAFVDGGRGGNPAGVVLGAERFDQAAKQRIAASVGLSETAFVSPSEIADFKLEFFTPTRQIAHCGHATIATFSYLVQQGLLRAERSSKETIDGTREIIIRGDQAFMEQRAPRYAELGTPEAPVSVEAVLESLALGPDALLDGRAPVVVNTGVNCLVVPLRSEAAVLGLATDMAAIERISEELDLVEYYVFSTETRVAGRAAGARMFAPRYGIPEEAATGMAAGPLACYLYDRLGLKQEMIVIEQGHLMAPPSPSELIAELRLEDGLIAGLMVGGRAVVSQTVEIDWP
ncbi:MAG TPA: PhzF family phenazine biosynthesis protein [Herpetosiphonaceae bacterium]